MLTYSQIVDNLKNETNFTPEELSRWHSWLAGDYALQSQELTDLERQGVGLWKELRATLETDKQAERAYDATEIGIGIKACRLRLKAIEKCIGAIKSLLETARGEARNQW